MGSRFYHCLTSAGQSTACHPSAAPDHRSPCTSAHRR